MRRTILPLLLGLAAFAHADVRITGAYPTDRAGSRIVPKVGEPFFLTVTLSASKGAAPFRVTIDAPSATLTTENLAFVGDGWIRRGEIVPLYDGPMDVTVSCAAAKASLKLRIVPTAPATAIETYRPQSLRGEIGVSAVFNRAAPRLLAWIPLPQSDFGQSVASLDGPANQATTREGQTVGRVEAKASDRIEARMTCATAASSVRTNLTLLRTVPMSAVRETEWLKPEERIQSTHKEVVAFARAATKGTNAQTPVVDVALALYSATLKRSVYAKTGAAPDALAALRNGKGECGDLSALFVAACRASGVPARPVVGFSLGNDAWHVWAEFLVPGKGWVPVDPAYALGLRPRSTFPLYFGTIPEMRDRVTLGKGFAATFGSERTSFLQTPQVFAFESNLKVRSASFWSRLSLGENRP